MSTNHPVGAHLRLLLAGAGRLLRMHTLSEGAQRFLVFIFLNVISWQCLIGAIMVLHARALGVDRGAVGILFSLLYFAGALGFITKPLAERHGSKRILMAGWTVRYLLVLPIVGTPLALHWWGAKAAAALLFVTISLFCITRSLAVVAWSSWIHEIVPAMQLGRFYTIETVVTRILTVAFGVLAFVALGKGAEVWRFAAIAAFGVIAGLSSLRLLRRVPGGAAVSHKRGPLHGSYRIVLRDRMFMGFMGCTALFNMIYVSATLLLALMLRDRLNIGAGTILLLMSCGNILAVPTTTRWRRIADRHGSPVVMAGNGLLVVFSLVALGFMRPGRAPLPLLVLICALIPIAESGNYMAVSRGYMLRMRPRVRHACNTIWSAGTNIMSGVASVFMGFWLQRGEGFAFRSAAWGAALLLLTAVWVALHLPVPQSDSPHDASPVYDPRQPLRSLGRVLRYVLRPSHSRVSIGDDN